VEEEWTVGARLVNAVLGFWLYLSAFAWSHSTFERANAWISGIVVVTAALVGLRDTKAGRYVNVLVGAWLILCALLMPPLRAATFWNQLIVGFALALFALAPSLSALRARRAEV
jgi:hypothetical protein